MTVLWNETDLVLATNGRLSSPSTFSGTGVSIDTRTLQPGDIFIAIQGENSNGNAYTEQAFAKGACCVITDQPPPETRGQNLYLQVPDPFQALNQMARYARKRFKGKTIAITGSVGKTTTKEMLKTALDPFGRVHAAEGSHNNHLGVPLTLARLPQDADYCICEIGMNHPGEIAPLAALVRPDIAVITMVSASHLGFMENLDAIAMEKGQIMTGLPERGIVILPETIHGMDHFKQMASEHQLFLRETGLSRQAEYRISTIALYADHSSFQLWVNQKAHTVTLSSPGEHLVHNAALVLGTIASLDLDINPAIQALTHFRAGSGRGQLLPLATRSGMVLDESYNASILSIQNALKTLSLLSGHRRIAVLGDVFELGSHAESEHLSLLPDLLRHADLVFACGPMMKPVFERLPPQLQGKWCPDAKELIPFIQQQLQDKDTVMVKGSHGMHMDQIVKTLTHKTDKRKN